MQTMRLRRESPISFAEAHRRTAIPYKEMAWMVDIGAVRPLTNPRRLYLSKLRKAHRQLYAIRAALQALKNPRN